MAEVDDHLIRGTYFQVDEDTFTDPVVGDKRLPTLEVLLELDGSTSDSHSAGERALSRRHDVYRSYARR